MTTLILALILGAQIVGPAPKLDTLTTQDVIGQDTTNHTYGLTTTNMPTPLYAVCTDETCVVILSYEEKRTIELYRSRMQRAQKDYESTIRTLGRREEFEKFPYTGCISYRKYDDFIITRKTYEYECIRHIE